jgi:hypothetical protein
LSAFKPSSCIVAQPESYPEIPSEAVGVLEGSQQRYVSSRRNSSQLSLRIHGGAQLPVSPYSAAKLLRRTPSSALRIGLVSLRSKNSARLREFKAAEAVNRSEKIVLCGYSLLPLDQRARELLLIMPKRQTHVTVVCGSQNERIAGDFRRAGLQHVRVFAGGYFEDWVKAAVNESLRP